MTIGREQYVPILKWRQGEYQALLRLDDVIKDKLVPLIVIPPVEWDFEEQKLKKNVEEHIEPFAKRLRAKWHKRPPLIHVHDSLAEQTVGAGERVMDKVFTKLRSNKEKSYPVVRLSRSKEFRRSIADIHAQDQMGIGFRVDLNELSKPGFNDDASDLLSEISVESEFVDLVIDVGGPKSFQPYADLANAIAGLVGKIRDLDSYRSFAIAGSSYSAVTWMKRPGGCASREEWMLYKQLIGVLRDGTRIPAYGDYGIESPEFVTLDMRLIKPAAKLIYATSSGWEVQKGRSFRDDPSQMKDQCSCVVKSAYFKGEEYSKGDRYILACANGGASTGNLSTWKWVGMNHHMTQVVEDLANFHAS